MRGICKKGLEWQFENGRLNLTCHPVVKFFVLLISYFFPPQLYNGRWSDDSSSADDDCFPFPEYGR